MGRDDSRCFNHVTAHKALSDLPKVVPTHIDAGKAIVKFNQDLPIRTVLSPNVVDGFNYPTRDPPEYFVTSLHERQSNRRRPFGYILGAPFKEVIVMTEPRGMLNISPDPNILIVLSNTPLKPIDALCELIDNSLDSFDAARRVGLRISSRWIRILLPSPTQVQNGEGVIRVVDNGIGLDRDGLQGALQAGFSTKNKYGALGLFGVGFNIASAKLGQRTVVTTARADLAGNTAGHGLKATIDLQELKRRGNFDIPLDEIANPERGTVVEISDWWPNGTPNQRFAFELVRL